MALTSSSQLGDCGNGAEPALQNQFSAAGERPSIQPRNTFHSAPQPKALK